VAGVLLVCGVLSACGLLPVRGSGRMVDETRHVGATFRDISLGSVVDVEYRAADPDDGTRVVLYLDDNLLEYVETRVRDGELQISQRPFASIRPSDRARIMVYGESLRELTSSGTADFSAERVEADKGSVRIAVTGTGDVNAGISGADEVKIRLTGTGDVKLGDAAPGGESQLLSSLDVVLSGTGNVNTRELPVSRADVTLTGTGSIRLDVRDRLTGTLSGTGNIHYWGEASESVTRTGTGRVYRR